MMAGSQQSTPTMPPPAAPPPRRRGLPTFGLDVDRQAKREALLEALMAVGGRMSQGAGTEGFGALAAAAGGFMPAYREGLDRQVQLGEFNRRRELEEEDAAWTRESRERQRQQWSDQERAGEVKASERTERMAQHRAAMADLETDFPDKKGFISDRLGLFVGSANFEEQYASVLDKLSAPAKEEKGPAYIRVTDASGRVVLKPRDEVIAAGGEVSPPRPPRQGEKEPRLTPAQVWNEIQQERGAILEEMKREGGPMVQSMGLPAGALDEAERRARARVKGLISPQDWERFSRGAPEPTTAPPPIPPATKEELVGKFPTGRNILGGPAKRETQGGEALTVEGVIGTLPPELRSKVDEADRAQIEQWISEGKPLRWILEQAGL